MKNENFIPISIQRLITDINPENNKILNDIFKLIMALYDFKFKTDFSLAKEHYQLFNPDIDVLIDNTRDIPTEQKLLLEKTAYFLQQANYTKLSIEDIENAINTQPHSGLNIQVDTHDYEIFDIYYRGDSEKQIIKKSWLNYIKQPKKETIKIYTRLFIVAKLKDIELRALEISKDKNINLNKAKKQLRKTYKKLPKNITNDFIFFKIFKDIPHLDLEMLFFVQTIKLKVFDKIKLFITGGFSTGAGIVATIGKIAVALNPIALLGAIGGLIGVIVKQISNLFNQHNKYQNTLTTSLYFQSLNNNLGAINYISNSASEEEIKEVILGYCFKLKYPTVSHTELDKHIENYLSKTYGVTIDFEIDDSIQKLENLELIQNNAVVDTNLALTTLNNKWDNIFI